ncbi:MAG: DUF115 domain-containing protein [Candidatus Dadabacteria bacterium]|nr:DUF115 domain-containing protein [Candidatus Dadabacteria bacterium]
MTASSLSLLTDLHGELNVPVEQIHEHIKENIKRHLPQVQPHEASIDIGIIATGGPSLVSGLKELRKDRDENKLKLITVNGVHDFLLENDITPSAQVLLDAREFTLNFVKNPVKSCKYFVASQCDPRVFDALEGHDVYIFHADCDGYEKILDRYYMGHYYTIEGGCTVTLRTIRLFNMLGYKFFHMYGFDSCYMGGDHHSYEQEINNNEETITVWCAGRPFVCAAWMVKQARELAHLIRYRGDLFSLNIHGDGLISHMIKTGATIREENKDGGRSLDIL